MKKYAQYAAAIMLTVLIFGRLGKVLEANYDGNRSMNGFYRMEKDTVDVMFYGSSHVYSGVNPVTLWDEYGIAGYDLAGAKQQLWNSYYNMKETLKYQSPKIMVVDLFSALSDKEYDTSANVIINASSMRFSMNKIRNIWSSVPHEDFLSYILSYPLTHDSYKDIRQANYTGEAKYYKGLIPLFTATNYDKLPEVPDNPERRTPSEKNREYLAKMVDLAKAQQIDLAFIVVPYEGWNAEDEGIYAWIEEFAAENDILFLNGNRNLEEMGFDSATDYAEESHLNYSGASKFTSYLGQWLKANCELEDHRGNELYESWQEYSEYWSSNKRNRELAQMEDLEAYIEALESREEYVIFVSLDDNYRNNPLVGMLGGLSEVDPFDFVNGGTYVIQSGNLLYRTPDEPEYLWYMETDSLDIAVSANYGESMELIINNQVRNNNANDVTIIVYDSKLDRIADVAAYNSDGVIMR